MPTIQEDCEYWIRFGLSVSQAKNDDSFLTATLPDGYIAIRAQVSAVSTMQKDLQAIGIPPTLSYTIASNEIWTIYRISSGVDLDDLQSRLSDGVSLLEPNSPLHLPMGTDLQEADITAGCLADVSEIDGLDNYPDESEQDDDHPLAKYSVRGQGAALEATAVAASPLLGCAVMLGQMTIIYGTPNVGKTILLLALLSRAIKSGKVEGHKVYYVNADDSSQGAAEKVKWLEPFNVHTLLPGHNGFSMEKLVPLMLSVVAEGKAAGCVLVVDTLKKIADLMSKADSTQVGNTVRTFVQAGGTFIALAHTNKHPGPNGKLSYAGTADFHQDADACLYLRRIAESPTGGEIFVQFEVFKQRGPNRDETYAYQAGPEVSYQDRLTSVRLVTDEEIDAAARQAAQEADADVIAGIRESIQDGNVKKMDLERSVRFALGVPRSRFTEVLDRYDGQFWAHQVRERGAKVYRLLN